MSENITITPAVEQAEGLETKLIKEVLAHILKDWLYEPMHGTINSKFITLIIEASSKVTISSLI